MGAGKVKKKKTQEKYEKIADDKVNGKETKTKKNRNQKKRRRVESRQKAKQKNTNAEKRQP